MRKIEKPRPEKQRAKNRTRIYNNTNYNTTPVLAYKWVETTEVKEGRKI